MKICALTGRITSQCLCVAGVALFFASPAAAETGSEITVSASTAYDSNPFLAFGGDRDVASFRLELAPSVYESDGVSSLRVSGRAEHVEYLKYYDSVQNLSANVAATHRINPRLDISADVLVSSGVSTTDFNRPVGVGDGTGAVPTLPIDDDVTLLGERQRRNLASVDVSLRYKPGEADELRWSSAVYLQRYPSGRLEDSDYASQRLAYTRGINGIFSLGGSVEASSSNFKGGRVGDAKMVSPQLSVTARIDSRLEAFASLGVSFTRTKLALGTDNSTTLAGSARICYKGSLSNFCLDGQRQVLPSAIGGVRKQTSVGASYSLRLSEREVLQLGGGYSRASAPLAGLGGNFESIRGYARYERQIDQRFSAFVSGGYSDTSDDLGIKRSNVQGLLGISYKFGNSR